MQVADCRLRWNVLDPVASAPVAEVWNAYVSEQAAAAPPAHRALRAMELAGIFGGSEPVVAPFEAEEGGAVGDGGNDIVTHASSPVRP